MADHHDDQAGAEQAVARAEVRRRYLAERVRLDAISDEEWAARRNDEVRFVRQWAAERRRSVA